MKNQISLGLNENLNQNVVIENLKNEISKNEYEKQQLEEKLNKLNNQVQRNKNFMNIFKERLLGMKNLVKEFFQLFNRIKHLLLIFQNDFQSFLTKSIHVPILLYICYKRDKEFQKEEKRLNKVMKDLNDNFNNAIKFHLVLIQNLFDIIKSRMEDEKIIEIRNPRIGIENYENSGMNEIKKSEELCKNINFFHYFKRFNKLIVSLYCKMKKNFNFLFSKWNLEYLFKSSCVIDTIYFDSFNNNKKFNNSKNLKLFQDKFKEHSKKLYKLLNNWNENFIPLNIPKFNESNEFSNLSNDKNNKNILNIPRQVSIYLDNYNTNTNNEINEECRK